MQHQIFQQANLARLQRDLAPATADHARQAIKVQIAAAQRRVLAARRTRAPPHQRLQSGQQFGKRERFAQVIIGAGGQSRYAIIGAAQRRQHQDGCVDFCRAHRLEQGKPVHRRQHPVEHDDIELPVGGHEQAVAAVVGTIDHKTLFIQPACDIFGDLAVVFDQQDSG